MRAALPWMLAALALSGCGPTEVEAGQAVLMMAPAITLVGALVAAGYAWLWRPLVEGLRFDRGLSARIIGLQLVACLGIPVVGGVEGDWLLAAFWFVGASYLSFQCLFLRMAITKGLRRHYSWLSLAPWLLLYGHAIWLGYFGANSGGADGIGVLVWILPGYLGLVTAPLMTILLVEVLVRRRRWSARLRAESLPRPLPMARVL